MKLYRFSPVKSKAKLLEAIRHIHFACHKLCKNTFGAYLPNSGNIGVFCHYPEEYVFLIALREKITLSSTNPNQKYFQLRKPIVIPAKQGVPKTTYTHLYIRKPDPYRHHVGDVDFYLEQAQYAKHKNALFAGKTMNGARIFDRPDLDMIELHDPTIDALAYVSTKKMVETVRVKTTAGGTNGKR